MTVMDAKIAKLSSPQSSLVAFVNSQERLLTASQIYLEAQQSHEGVDML